MSVTVSVTVTMSVAVRHGLELPGLVDIVPLGLGSPHVNFPAMGKTVILSEQTARDLLEAYASLAAWYYQLWGALRSGSGSPQAPGEAARVAFLERLAQDYPELAPVARTITSPRPFLPPPPALPAPYADTDKAADEPATVVEPAAARHRESMASEPPATEVSPPPFVAPGSVKYNS